MRALRSVGVLMVFLAAAAALAAEAEPVVAPAGPIPDPFGTNIHFTGPQPGEMKMLAGGGFHWIRMDFVWSSIERAKGRYTWDHYDRLVKAAEPHGIRFLFILDYSNKLYETDRSVRTEAGRQAMARWAAAAVKRYQGRGILWEMWNEPNLTGFWRPTANVEDYAKLARAVGEAIRRAAPGERYIGPATSGIPLDFLEGCFRRGLLEHWCAVSVHPYRQQRPETVVGDYRRLRALIRKYAPKAKRVPILSGEWGYSSAWGRMNEQKQGKYLPRQWLTNLANDIPVSIWYDWHDDGRDPKEAEHHFGTVLNPVHRGRDPVYDPKPAYLAARTLTTVLKGFRFSKRLRTGQQNDWVLLLSRGKDTALAAWTAQPPAHACAIPASPGRFRAIGHTGKELPAVTADDRGLRVELTDAPVYLIPAKPNDLLRVAAAWERAPLEVRTRGRGRAELRLAVSNPLDRPIRVRMGEGWTKLAPGGRGVLGRAVEVDRRAEPRVCPIALEVLPGGRAIVQSTALVVTNPLSVRALPAAGKTLCLEVDNPSGEPLRGHVELTDVQGLRPAGGAKARLAIRKGETEKRVTIDLAEGSAKAYRFGLRVVDEAGAVQVTVPPMRFAVADDLARYTPDTIAKAYRLVPDGDPKVASRQSFALGEPPAGPPLPGVRCLRIRYDFDDGWKFIRLVSADEARETIEGRPTSFGLWVHGNGSGDSIRLRFRDATGQTFQPDGGRITWRGWRHVTFAMDGRRAGHWGGAGDGVVHPPIRWDTLVLIDSAGRRKTSGEVYVASPTLIH